MVSDAIDRASKNDLLDLVRFESLKQPINASNHPSVSKLLTLAENADEKMFNEILERVRSTDGSKCQ